MASFTPDQKRAAVGKHVLQLFSGRETSLNFLKDGALAASNAPGIESFFTPLSWRMQLKDGRVIQGDAENLSNAVKDVANQTALLMQTYPADTKASLSIDEAPVSLIPKILGGL